MRLRLTRKQRLLKAQQFKQILKAGRKSSYKRELSVFCMENLLSLARVGIIVPKKNVKLSTRRNRAKRLFREAFRLNQARIKPGLDILIYSYKGAESLDQAQSSLIEALKKANALL